MRYRGGSSRSFLACLDLLIGQTGVVDRARFDGPRHESGGSHSQQQRHDKRSVPASQFHHQYHGRDRALCGGRENRCRTEHGEQSGGHTGPEPRPGMPQNGAEQCAYCQGRCEQAAGGAAAHAQHGRGGLQRKQHQQQSWRYWLVNASCEMSLPLPSNCGNEIETTPSRPNPRNGAVSRRQPCGLLRSAQVTART